MHRTGKIGSSAYSILCLGNVLADILVKPVDRLPAKGGLMLVSDIRAALGGCASNTAAALGKMGARVAILGKVGRDAYGRYVVGELRKAGVDTRRVLTDATTPTSATLVLVDRKGQRSFLHSVAANAELVRREVVPSLFKGFRHLHVGGYFLFPGLDGAPMGGLLKKARRMGLVTTLDTAWDIEGRWMKALAPCLPHLDYFLPSELEVGKLLGHRDIRRAARTFTGMGVGCVIIKRGSKGAFLRHRDGREVSVPALRVRVADTTGAGDCFCAGFIKGLSLGWGLERCLGLACAAGACAVREVGATAGIHSFSQVRGMAR
jgi:sugar/nucleoside kinase (ribokinase family)